MKDTDDSDAAYAIIERSSWLGDGSRFAGEWQGQTSGASISVIANEIEAVGDGVKLHQHPYAETFIVRKGTVAMTIGSDQLTCHAGQILVLPANTPHAFWNHGPGPLEMIDIHESHIFVTEWL
jgi:mannose-6-phosphate isomerase-like protein (cupin superfamily)